MDKYINILIVIGIIGASLGVLLGIASKFLTVKEDPRIAAIIEMLPNFNCGSCGYAGCAGMAKGIVDGEAKLTQCKPGKEPMREKITKYLEEYNNQD